MNIGKLCGFFYCVCLFAVGREGNVAFNGVAKKEVVLRHVCAEVSKRMNGNGVNVMAVDKQSSVVYVIGAQNEVHDGGFAGARGTDNTNVFAGVNMKRHVTQRIVCGAWITEGQIFKGDIAFHSLKRSNTLFVANVGGGIQQFADAVERSLTARAHINEFRDCHNRPNDGGKIPDKLNELTCVEYVLIYKVATVA